jgi:c(7)-type cytochrome triheme protein
MRAALAIAVLCAWSGAARAQPAPGAPRALRTTAEGFDHNVHARDVDVSVAPAIACTRCHAIKSGALVGRPGHAGCFGSCHGAMPARRQPVTPERMRLCSACHAETTLASATPGKVSYPPYTLGREFALQIGHKAHASIACGACHDRRPAIPHRRCLGCHDGSKGKGPVMAECSTCHTPASGVPDPPMLVRTKDTQIFVTTAFSHARHAGRGVARQCTTCHAAIIATNDRQLPRPTTASCAIAGCHDGKASFGVTASCTKCHQDVPTTKYEMSREVKRFNHALHEPLNLACASCHPLGKSGEVLVANHAPCAACHAKDFGERFPKICTACHIGTEPWRPLVADRLPAERTEFGATLDHRKHPSACASCHSLTTAISELRPARGHRACSGTACHAAAGGPAPQLTACESCHQRGLAAERDRTRRAATWSVRALFKHASHLESPRITRQVACVACHDDLTSPTTLSLAVPPKQTCAPCHDGQLAFKLTGTTCTRCHLGVATASGATVR